MLNRITCAPQLFHLLVCLHTAACDAAGRSSPVLPPSLWIAEDPQGWKLTTEPSKTGASFEFFCLVPLVAFLLAKEKILIHVVPPSPNIVYKNIHRQAIITIWFHRYLKVCQAVDALRAGSTQQHEWLLLIRRAVTCDYTITVTRQPYRSSSPSRTPH